MCRWRLFSLSSGDSLKSWRIEPFIMVEGGTQVPPRPLCFALWMLQRAWLSINVCALCMPVSKMQCLKQ